MEKEKFQQIKEEVMRGHIPVHVAIIMDGNGRWAQARGMERTKGHVEGVQSVIEITRACSNLGVRYLTLYGFSTENWNRPKAEVDLLMHLIGVTVEQQTPYLLENNVRLKIIGDKFRIPRESLRRLEKAERTTENCTGMRLLMALSYSARWEIAEAVRNITANVIDGDLRESFINEEVVARHLETWDCPDPDLLIRTGGELRISNFLLWQCAYSELYFSPVYWPEFREPELVEAIRDYQSRERRFGKTSKQVSNSSN